MISRTIIKKLHDLENNLPKKEKYLQLYDIDTYNTESLFLFKNALLDVKNEIQSDHNLAQYLISLLTK